MYLLPDADTAAALLRREEELSLRAAALQKLSGVQSVTADGQRVTLCANVGSPAEAVEAMHMGAEGIGLFRSEYLCLGRRTVPTEEEQYAAYRAALQAAGDCRVVIRTFDIGADKQADFLGLPQEENPALGLRGLRLCLAGGEMFRTQLRALYRAAVGGRLAVLLPMVTSVWELRETRGLIAEICDELERAGMPFSRAVPLGVMIETPAAALLSDVLAREADFFSVGTNDLTQYTLAADRQNQGVARYYSQRHTAVLRLLKLAADNAHQNSIPIAVCGELAADEAMLPLLLAMGIDELSVPAAAILSLREKVLQTDAAAARPSLQAALSATE